MSHQEKFSYAQIANVELLEQLYATYLENPENVDASWRYFFEGMDFAAEKGGRLKEEPKRLAGDCRVYSLIQAYRTFGYLLVPVNPIATKALPVVKELELSTYGIKQEELSHIFPTFGLLSKPHARLQEILDALKSIYCSKIGIEYMGMQNPALDAWLQEKVEPSLGKIHLTIEEKKMTLDQLNKSELFEVFLHTKFVGQKRFSLEGGETLIPMLQEILEQGSELGMTDCIIGMAHRGRLNVLVNILKKSYSMVFSEFEDDYVPDPMGSGDVKYHKGFSSDITTPEGRQVHVSLTANPSHLESVNPVVEGQARAKQVLKGDEKERSHVVPVLIHGDAAISGQGVVYETMQLCRLKGYSTGGTLHIVINNQIGFTTLPQDSRSTANCTDIAHTFSAPVFHVNAEDPESCIFATHLAIELRQKFHCDVFIELNCYRKYGHNESDEPAFTQPLEYQIIRRKKPIREIYRDALIKDGSLEKQLLESLEGEFKEALQKALDDIKNSKKEPRAAHPSTISATEQFPLIPKELFEGVPTQVDLSLLQEIGKLIRQVPEGFHLYKKVESLAEARLKMLQASPDQKCIDWGMAETLAFGTLLWEGRHIRLSGQDSRRGTFSHRHAQWVDQNDAKKYFPLSHLKPDQGKFDVYNSPLSEFAVLGFEYGYSITYPKALVIWEAQFGDFCNEAQVIIDQYITTAEQKWGRSSGLTLFLPHGYEGQGPEHSSARIERFLQLAGDANIQVVNPTTPAQLFHLLRRQALREIQKPLIVLTPKGLLRHPECVSSSNDLTQGCFEEILDDPLRPKKTRRLVLCSGRIYYDLAAEREKRKIDDVAIVRVEQLYPLHVEKLQKIVRAYEGFKDCYWVQDEPSNMGAWDFIKHVLYETIGSYPLYVGRRRSASPAAGSHALHLYQHEVIMNQVFKD